MLEIANDIHNAYNFSQFEWDGRNEGGVCSAYFVMLHNHVLHPSIYHMSEYVFTLTYAISSNRQSIIKRAARQ